MNTYMKSQQIFSEEEMDDACNILESRTELRNGMRIAPESLPNHEPTVLRCAPFGINSSGIIVYLNSVWTILTGYRIEESLGQTLSSVFSKSTNMRMLREFEEALTTNAIIRGELLILTPHGRRVWLEVNARTKVAPEQNIVGITGEFIDISARKFWPKRPSEL